MAENRKIIIEVVARTSGAEKSLNKVGTETEKTGQQAQKASKSFLGLGKTFTAIARGFVIVKSFQLLARTITDAVKVAAEFELTMAKVKAITGATQKEFVKLEKSARELALGTIFTAQQVGELQLAYSKLGFTTDEILAATEATLNLATATGEDLASAADVVGATIRGFGLDAEETGRVVDVMAKSFTSSALNLESFKQSMKTVAPIAAAANVDIETTTALLGKLADAGLRGTRAATGLRNLMSQLTDPTSKLAKELNFTVQNSDGLIFAFRELAKRNIDLSKATGLTDKRSKAAFLTLINGISSVDDLREALDLATGSAEDMSDIMGDTLIGNFKRLQSEWDETKIAFTKTEVFNDFTNFLTALVIGIREGSDAMHQFNAEMDIAKTIDPEVKAMKEAFAEFDRIRREDLISIRKRHQALREAAESESQRKEVDKNEEQEVFDFKKKKDEQLLALRERFVKHFKDLSQEQQDIRDEITEKETGDLFREIQARKASIEAQKEDIEVRRQNGELVDASEERMQKSKEILDDLAHKYLDANTEIATNNEEYKKAGRVSTEYEKIAKKVSDRIKETAEFTRKLNAEINVLTKDVGLGSLQKFFDSLFLNEASTRGTASFEKAVSEAADAAGKLNVSFDETLEKLPETQDNTEQVTFTWFEHAEAIAEVIDQYGKHLDAMGMLTSSMNDLFQTLTMNRLNQIVEQNDAELQIFDETQEEIRKKQEITDNHAVESFIGTQKEKADFERHLALERIEQEKRVDDERKALRQRQLKEENDIARKGFMANKANAIAQVGINLAQEITSIALNASGNPNNIWSFGAAGASQFAILSSIAVANSALQTAAIASQKFQPKTFQDGGTIVGASHSDGGVPFTVAGQAGFEAEGGEYIFSKSTVNRLGTGILDAINFGGASPRMFADGGAIGRATMEASTISQLSMQETLREIVGSITEIPVVNVAQETVDTSRLVENAAAMARL